VFPGSDFGERDRFRTNYLAFPPFFCLRFPFNASFFELSGPPGTMPFPPPRPCSPPPQQEPVLRSIWPFVIFPSFSRRSSSMSVGETPPSPHNGAGMSVFPFPRLDVFSLFRRSYFRNSPVPSGLFHSRASLLREGMVMSRRWHFSFFFFPSPLRNGSFGSGSQPLEDSALLFRPLYEGLAGSECFSLVPRHSDGVFLLASRFFNQGTVTLPQLDRVPSPSLFAILPSKSGPFLPPRSFF